MKKKKVTEKPAKKKSLNNTHEHKFPFGEGWDGLDRLPLPPMGKLDAPAKLIAHLAVLWQEVDGDNWVDKLRVHRVLSDPVGAENDPVRLIFNPQYDDEALLRRAQ